MEKIRKCSWTLDDAMHQADIGIGDVKNGFVKVGFYLKYIRDEKLWKERYSSFDEFMDDNYAKDKSWASRCINLYGQFGAAIGPGEIPRLDERYAGYNISQLIEMLSMPEEQRWLITPKTKISEIREMKPKRKKTEPPAEVATVATSEPGEEPTATEEMRMLENRAPEVLPEEEPNPCPEEMEPEDTDKLQLEDATQSQLETVTPLSEPEAAQGEADNIRSVNMVDIDNPLTRDMTQYLREQGIQAQNKTIIDTECTESVQSNESELTDLQIAQKELERAQELLSKCLKAFPDEKDVHIRSMKIKVCALASYVWELDNIENPPPASVQPELPLLKNNDQRAAFVDAYETWPLWIETVQTGERYYRYDLEDGTSMVVKVYHARLFDYKAYGTAYEERFSEGWGKQEYYLLQPGKFFRDCETNRSTLIDKLKEIQKAKKG